MIEAARLARISDHYGNIYPAKYVRITLIPNFRYRGYRMYGFEKREFIGVFVILSEKIVMAPGLQ